MSQQKPFRIRLFREEFSEKQRERNQTPYGALNLEKRRHPRFNVDLPIEYYQIDSSINHTGHAFNASNGGLLLYLTEQMDIGQQLKGKLFFTSGSDLNTIQVLAEVAWVDIDLGEVWGDYRCGGKFIDVSPEDMTKLKKFLGSLLG